MYEELVKTLRSCPDEEYGCSMCKYKYSLGCREKLMNVVADAIEELSKPKWIPVTDELPKDCRVYLVVLNNVTVDFCLYREGLGFGMYVNNTWEYANDEVTHWMPLPSAPEPDEPPKEET